MNSFRSLKKTLRHAAQRRVSKTKVRVITPTDPEDVPSVPRVPMVASAHNIPSISVPTFERSDTMMGKFIVLLSQKLYSVHFYS